MRLIQHEVEFLHVYRMVSVLSKLLENRQAAYDTMCLHRSLVHGLKGTKTSLTGVY